MNDHCDVLIIGGGPAGLTAATELARDSRVIVLERERAAGGIPRHSDHTGYGVRDLRRVMSGPSYAKLLASRAIEAGADIRTDTMMTDWVGDRSVVVTSPQGRYQITAEAIILATGAIPTKPRSRTSRVSRNPRRRCWN